MANPQPDKYTKLSNELLDALIRYRIPGEQMQVFLFIIRKTYGFNKKKDAIALSQFVEATGIKKTAISRAIKGLLTKKIIRINKKDNELAHVYEIIKDYEKWIPLTKKITLTKKIISVNKKDNLPLTKKGTTKDNTTKDIIKDKKNTVDPNGSTAQNPLFSDELFNRKNKDKIKPENFKFFFEEVWQDYPKKTGKNDVSITQKKKLYKKGDEIKRALGRYLKFLEGEKNRGFNRQPVDGKKFFNKTYEDYLDDNYEEPEDKEVTTIFDPKYDYLFKDRDKLRT